MLTTVGWTLLTIAVYRIVEALIEFRGVQDRTWKEGDEVPDAVD